MQSSGIASIAARVGGDDQDAGVPKSPRPGTKRRVKTVPTKRGEPGVTKKSRASNTLRGLFVEQKSGVRSA